jgi:Flp pilus assembly protein TadD
MPSITQRLAQAVQHHQAGRLGEAEALYRAILSEAPRQADALHLLGVLVHQTGRHAEAIDLIRRALALHGPHPVFHSNLAAVYLAADSLDEAVAHSREAIRLKPDLADAHANLGVALRRQGLFDEAAAAAREALRLNPAHVDARCNLGAVLHQQGLLPQAAAVLQETVRRAPAHAQAQSDLGGVLVAASLPAQAAVHLREALRLRPDFVEAHSNLGLALRDLNRTDEALECFRQALRLKPGDAKARNNLAYLLEVQGRTAEAVAEYRQTLHLDPDNAAAISGLSKLATAGHYRFSDQEVRAIRELTERPDLPAGDRCRLHFALAWVDDQAGAWDEAFEHCRRANELRKEFDRRRGVVFDLAAERQFMDRLRAVFTPEYFERARPFGLDTELPVFIVGMLRSGTSLAEHILASHPRVHGAGEVAEMERLVGALNDRLGPADDYPECLARLDAATARSLAERHVRALGELGGEADRVTDKLPLNFRHLGLIATLFPRARIIHCRRDPVDTCLSCYFQNFADPPPFTLDLRHLGQYYREYERLMAHWARVLPVPVFELRYEELTADQEALSRRLVAFCGLEWEERCLRFNDTRRVVRTASTLQVRQPMYRSSVGRWKHYQAHLKELTEALGITHS